MHVCQLFGKKRASINKADIQVLHEEVGDVPGFFTLTPLEEAKKLNNAKEENVYEEPELVINGPDVKISTL